MGNAHDFIFDLYNEFKAVENLLKNLLREEEILEHNILTKSGFLIRHYSLRLDSINLDKLRELKEELERVEAIESDIKYRIREARNYLVEIEKDYHTYKGEKLNLKRIFTQTMNNAFQMSRLARVRINELIEILESGLRLHKQQLGGKAERLVISLERMTNQILGFINLLEQLDIKIGEFEKESYYPSPKLYGRAMNVREFKKTIKEKQLSSPKEPTPVFDCSPTLIRRLESMPLDTRKNFFGRIGVVGGIKIVFFKTRLKPINWNRPIPQRNGLREYKFPKRTPVEILEAA